MFSRAQLKDYAKQIIEGRLGILFLCNLVVFVCCMVLNVPVVGIAAAIAFIPCIEYGILYVYYNLTEGMQPSVADIFMPFKEQGFYLKVLGTYWLTILFTFLWSLLFFIPGIIKALSYSMAPYIINENRNMTASEAITESRRLMNHHKAELFFLSLSFIGWFLLTSVTFGLVGIYAVPYYQATMAAYYKYIKACNGDYYPAGGYNPFTGGGFNNYYREASANYGPEV